MAEAEFLSQAVDLTRIISSNLQEVIKEWITLSATPVAAPHPQHEDNSEYVTVKRSVLCHLATEITMMKDLLPNVLEHCSDRISALTTQLNNTEQSTAQWDSLTNEKQVILNERNQTTHRLSVVIKEFEKEKKDHFELKSELSEVNHQLSYQSDYCTSLGLVCCTLLWRASRNEQAVQEMIRGNKTGDFLSLVSTTTTSFLDSYSDNNLPNESSKEMQFLLSLYGVVTNISASAYGRECISDHPEGHNLLHASFDLLSTSSVSQKSAKLQNLVLMMLFNISINQKGLLLVRRLPRVFHALSSLCQANTSAVNKVHCLQLLQSLLLEPHDSSLIEQVQREVPVIFLHELTAADQHGISQLAKEIIMDIETLCN